MHHFASCYDKLINLFCSHQVIFYDVEETERLIGLIHDQTTVTRLEKMYLKSMLGKPLKDVRNNLKVTIIEILEKAVAELQEFCQKKVDEFRDPISKELIIDPVTLNETGDLYDRKTLMSFFRKSHKDPISGRTLKSRLTNDSLYIRNRIEEFLGEFKRRTVKLAIEMKDFIRCIHSNIVVMGYFPLKNC